MSRKDGRYLGKKGKAFGPFTDAEFEKIKSSGQIAEYTYEWNHAAAKWIALEPPPPSLHAGPGAVDLSRCEALCFDLCETLLSGELRNVNDEGCELVSRDGSSAPRLGLSSVVTLNLLDPIAKQSINLQARLMQVLRKNGEWIYLLKWQRV